MGAVLVTTLSVSFAALELPIELTEVPGASAEAFVSSGGADLSDRIRDAFEGSAATAGSASERMEIRARGERLALETSAAVRSAFAQATRRIYWLTAMILVVATMLATRVPELPLRTTHDRALDPSAEKPHSSEG